MHHNIVAIKVPEKVYKSEIGNMTLYTLSRTCIAYNSHTIYEQEEIISARSPDNSSVVSVLLFTIKPNPRVADNNN